MAYTNNTNNNNKDNRKPDGYLNINIVTKDGTNPSLGRTIRLFADNFKDNQMLVARERKGEDFVINLVATVVPVVSDDEQKDIEFG